MTTTTESASMAFARSLFTRGTDVFGAEEIKQVFGLDIEVSPITLTEEELTAARLCGQALIFQPDSITMKAVHDLSSNQTSDGKPLYYSVDWYANEQFYLNDTLRPGWRLVSHEVIPGSRSEDYLGQTAALREYLVNTIISNPEMAKVAGQAISEFDREKKALEKLLAKDWQEAAQKLAGLQINQRFREKPVEVMWRLALCEQMNHERLLAGTYSWTNALSSDGRVVDLGDFDGRGVYVDYDNPQYSYGILGSCFSRS